MSNYTSQNLGAGKNERVRHGCRSGVTIGMTMGAIFAVVFYVFAKPLVYAFISDGNLEAVDVGVDFLHIVTPFYMFLSIKLIRCRRFSVFAACGIRGRSAGLLGLCCRRRCTWFGRVN